jgi:DNA-binding winged helix-turn-helix (wHTH) protein
MEPSPEPRTIRFGAFEADLRSGEVFQDGRKIPLQDKPFRVLARLLQRPGDLVTREELRLELWPGETFVDFEHGLNTAVRKLRQALDDSADSPRYVETLARRGYRLVAPLEAPHSRPVATESGPEPRAAAGAFPGLAPAGPAPGPGS